jgi:hypothetical protein
MSSVRCRRRPDGFSYVELLVALAITLLVFAPAYQCLTHVLSLIRADAARAAAEPPWVEALARELRCAVDDPNMPFHCHDGMLRFARCTATGASPRIYEGVRLRFFDGDVWSDGWGWDAENGRPARGVRGLPLAVEARLPDGTRRVMPVMVAVINGWPS